uniref:Phosphate transport system permease protein n=1 Tax=uncultured bacterium contig00016 TaxID=1181507 RepID=A0A806KII3_9BACT|nr:phosphate transport system permease protein PstC (TC 3.A.1.7.1) [uncultured bacterium contig00016]
MRKFLEKIIEKIFAASGLITTITILLIIVFLFKEGSGLFKGPIVEKGYALCVNADNHASHIGSAAIKQIYNRAVENWAEVEGTGNFNEKIIPFRLFNDIVDYYSEDELDSDEKIREKLGELIAKTPGMLAFVPQDYLPKDVPGVKILDENTIRPRDFFLGMEWIPTSTPAPQFGVLTIVLGTLLVSLVAILIATPLGIGVAIYLSELANGKVRDILKPAIELLAGIPSVVYGFFGLVVLVPIVQRTFNLSVGETAFTASVILAIMALPTIISVSEDAMRSTPRAMREASLALGATHWQTIYKVIIPYASSGISAAIVLGIGRAIGETMVALMVTGNAARMPELFGPVRTVPATIAAELGEAPFGGVHYQALFVLGCVLFLVTLAISITAELISKRQHNKGL